VSVSPRAAISTGPTAPAFVLGLALGGFIDGIVLHQILQSHHLLTRTRDHPSGTVSGLEANTLADGFFHLATCFLVAAGMVLTVRRAQARHRTRLTALSLRGQWPDPDALATCGVQQCGRMSAC
jgi:uncharacterized membrane protein